MSTLHVPDVLTSDRCWSSDELDARARRWHAAVRDTLRNGTRPVAAAVPTSPEGVALLIAVTALPVPVVLLVHDQRAWRADPPLPPGTTIVLPPSLAALAPAVQRSGWVACTVSDGGRSDGAPLSLLQSPGIVLFTSGSTGSPQPAFRSMKTLLANAAARLSTLGVGPGDGIIAGVSMAHGNGLTRMLSAMLLGGPLGLLNPVDHRAALAMLALPRFAFWSATAHFADVLGRCTLTAPPVAPRVCLLSSPISRAVFDRFAERFGVPLRQNYSSTETGSLTVDAGPPDDVRPETVGRPLPGVEFSIGDHPREGLQAGTVGRIWVRSPWQMEGYGFPPDLKMPGVVEGWWPTRDLGAIEKDGRLRLSGRLDDCVRTREGRLVNLFAVADRLRHLHGVRAVEVVPIDAPAGMSVGAVLECEAATTLSALRRQLSDELPPWEWPRRMAIVASLPRLPNGKPDRRACLAVLDA
jgi:acyl-CoA synthetase (AMP-forming)/AMP-acid ligase II